MRFRGRVPSSLFCCVCGFAKGLNSKLFVTAKVLDAQQSGMASEHFGREHVWRNVADSDVFCPWFLSRAAGDAWKRECPQRGLHSDSFPAVFRLTVDRGRGVATQFDELTHGCVTAVC